MLDHGPLSDDTRGYFNFFAYYFPYTSTPTEEAAPPSGMGIDFHGVR